MSADPVQILLDTLAKDISGNIEMPWELIREALKQAYDAGYEYGAEQEREMLAGIYYAEEEREARE